MALNFIIHLTTFCYQAGADLPLPIIIKLCFFQMPIESKVFIQTLQKSQARHKNRFSFEFNNKNTKKVFVIGLFGWGRFAPPQYN